MREGDEKNEAPRSFQPQSEDSSRYKVGKNKPPIDNQWKRGQSGNPSGRPVGSKNKPKSGDRESLSEMILRQAKTPIRSRDGSIEIPRSEAVLEATTKNALSGKQGAQRLYFSLLQLAETLESKKIEKERRDRLDLVKTIIEYKTEWEIELREQERCGAPGPQPIYHPDDIHIYPSGFIILHNFFTGKQLEETKKCESMLAHYKEALESLKKDLEDPEQSAYHDQIEAEIVRYEDVVERLRRVLTWKPHPLKIELLE